MVMAMVLVMVACCLCVCERKEVWCVWRKGWRERRGIVDLGRGVREEVCVWKGGMEERGVVEWCIFLKKTICCQRDRP